MISLVIWRYTKRKWHIQIDLQTKKIISNHCHTHTSRQRVCRLEAPSQPQSRNPFIFSNVNGVFDIFDEFPHFSLISWRSKPLEYSTAFVISRIIKSDVTIIFILLSALGLIANYCYWVLCVYLNRSSSLIFPCNEMWDDLFSKRFSKINLPHDE